MAPLPRPLDARSEGAPRAALRRLAVVLLAALGGCGEDDGAAGPLPVLPVLVSPPPEATLETDTPLFAVTNARGFDSGEASYTFRVVVASTDRAVASMTVPAGRGQTTTRFADPLLRGATLAWSVIARDAAGSEAVSESATFRLPPVDCLETSDPWAKAAVGFWVPATCRAQNSYDDPEDALGPPDAGRFPDGSFFGFVSLGNGGWVDVDMEGCAVDEAGGDVRVFQSVSGEPVTLHASSSPRGPWVLLESRKTCNVPSAGTFSRHCDFDLAEAGIEEARYFRVQDGELFPCPGGTDSEGADIDAVEILSVKP